MLLPHDGEAMYGGAVKHLAFGAPRSVDLVGVGAPGLVDDVKTAAGVWSFCPLFLSSPW